MSHHLIVTFDLGFTVVLENELEEALERVGNRYQISKRYLVGQLLARHELSLDTGSMLDPERCFPERLKDVFAVAAGDSRRSGKPVLVVDIKSGDQFTVVWTTDKDPTFTLPLSMGDVEFELS